MITVDEFVDELEEDEFDVLPDNHIINIAPLIQQGFYLDAPLQPLCSESCKGLCLNCGTNLNVSSCSCEQTDTAEDETNPFAVLKNLNLSAE